MNYLFFDCEFATSKRGNVKMCEFGYVLTNEYFEILKKDNFIMNPNIKKREWDYRVVNKILTREVYEYEQNPSFYNYYNEIVELINNSDYIFGHTLDSDANALNCECKRYGLPSINFEFYDIKEFYKIYSDDTTSTSLENMVKELDISSDKENHDGESDAFNTMLILKEILNKLNIKIDTLIKKCENAQDYNNNYKVKSHEERMINKFDNYIKALEENKNKEHKQKIETKALTIFLEMVKPITNEEKTLNNITFSMSKNFEYTHFKETINIIQLLYNKGAKYLIKASSSNYFVKYDMFNHDNKLIRCNRLLSVIKAKQNHADINIISFEEFLNMLDITEEELNNMPYPEYNLLEINTDKKIFKNEYISAESQIIIENKYISKEQTTKFKNQLGDLFSDVFEKILKK